MKQIDLEELQQWKAEGKAFHLVDVREPEERERLHIGGVFLPLSELSGSKLQLPADRPVVVYCKRGMRSQIAIQRLSLRYPDMDFYNLRGGIWPLLYTH